MADQPGANQGLEEITDGTKSARDKLNAWKRAIEALQKDRDNNPAKGYGPLTVLGSIDGVATYMSVLVIISGPPANG